MRDRQSRLGVDIGRVITDGPNHPEGGDVAFFQGATEVMLRTPTVPGAFETLARLVTRFEGRVWVVSKCGERVQRRTLQWLEHHDFAGQTGIPTEHVRFCRQWADKAIHCAELSITHFVDDKLEVHKALREIVPHRYLFGEQRKTPRWVQHTPTWAHAEEAITATLAGTPAGRDQ